MGDVIQPNNVKKMKAKYNVKRLAGRLPPALTYADERLIQEAQEDIYRFADLMGVYCEDDPWHPDCANCTTIHICPVYDVYKELGFKYLNGLRIV